MEYATHTAIQVNYLFRQFQFLIKIASSNLCQVFLMHETSTMQFKKDTFIIIIITQAHFTELYYTHQLHN